MRKAVEIGAGLLGVGNPEDYRFGSVFIFYFLQVRSGGVKRLVPGDAFPRTVSTLTGAFHGILESVRVVNEVQLRFPARAVGYPGVGYINLYNLTVPDMNAGRAGSRAHIADAIFRFYGLGHYVKYSPLERFVY